MNSMKVTLKIPGDRSSAKITSNDGCIHFEGDGDQAARITFAMPAMVGGNMYTVSAGELFEHGDVMCLKIEDGAGLDNDVEIEFADNTVRRVSVTWR